VCSLKDQKTQKEFLYIQDLTLASAIEKAIAAEAVNREVLHFPAEADTLKLYNQQKPCHRCGHHGHSGTTCIHRNKCCHVCNKIGHFSSVCKHNQQQKPSKQRPHNPKNQSRSAHAMKASNDSRSSDEEFDTNQIHLHKNASSYTKS